MSLENIFGVATVFGAMPEELEKSGIPDSVHYQVCAFGYIGGRETFVNIVSGAYSHPHVLICPDTSSDWSERIPLLAQKIAESINCSTQLRDDGCATEVILSNNPTQAQAAKWIKSWSQYFDDNKFTINRIRYYDIASSLIDNSIFKDRMRTDVQ